jgi:hypothetical protein
MMWKEMVKANWMRARRTGSSSIFPLQPIAAVPVAGSARATQTDRKPED